MNPTTLMYCPKTLRRLFTIPCVSIDIARQIALAQEATLNVVRGDELIAGYFAGQMIAHGHLETTRWMKHHGLKLPEHVFPVQIEHERLARKHRQWLARQTTTV